MPVTSSPSQSHPHSDPPTRSTARSPADATALPATGFLRQPRVLACVPFSRATLWRRVRQKAFPAPVKLSTRITAWRVEDVRRWIDSHAAAAEPETAAPTPVASRPAAVLETVRDTVRSRSGFQTRR